MKKIILLPILIFFLQANAQTINGLSIYPPNPTTNDSILILAECMFSSGSCDQHTQGFFVSGSGIVAWALHCIGSLTVICTDTDTFAVGMLPAGPYIANFQLDEGHGGPPCTPGIAPGPNANVIFTVSTATAVDEAEKNNSVFIYPNPAGNLLAISSRQFAIKQIDIYDVLGQKNSSYRIVADNQKPVTIDISALKPGIYIMKVVGEKESHTVKMFKN